MREKRNLEQAPSGLLEHKLKAQDDDTGPIPAFLQSFEAVHVAYLALGLAYGAKLVLRTILPNAKFFLRKTKRNFLFSRFFLFTLSFFSASLFSFFPA